MGKPAANRQRSKNPRAACIPNDLGTFRSPAKSGGKVSARPLVSKRILALNYQ
jgi:hypothetical protein